MKVALYDGVDWSIRPVTKQNIDILLNDCKHSEMDVVIVIDGPEGLGKSFAGRGLGKYCATQLGDGTTFTADDIHFDTDEYMAESLRYGKPKDGKHKINVLDESKKALNRKSSTTREVKKFVEFLSECRDLQQVHIILLPAYHDLEKYIVLWRMSLLIHFKKKYIEDKESATGLTLKRGEFFLYTDKRNLQFAYFEPYTYPRRYDEHNWWSSKEVFSEDELDKYKAKKFAATVSKYGIEKQLEQLDIKDVNQYMSTRDFAKNMGVTVATVQKWTRDGKVKARKIGNTIFVAKDELNGPED